MKKYGMVFVLILVLASCSTTNTKDIVYFENLQKTTTSQVLSTATDYEPTITFDDQLSITVTGIDPKAVAMFNLPLASYPNIGSVEVYNNYQLQTFIVDKEGNINYPVIGKIKVCGLTRTQLIKELENQISKYANNPMVNVSIVNFKVSVLGEVNQPGPKKVITDRFSILDAISSAGDLTIYGERNNILVIREINGKKEYNYLDLTSTDIFQSPYYYLRQNDIVYVAPNKHRQSNSKFSQKDQYTLSIVSTIISAVSVIASLSVALLVNKK